jgi:hypothetical protein
MQPPMVAAKLHDFSIAVDRAAVQQRDHWPAQVSQQFGEVLHDLNGRHVPGIDLEIQPQLLTQRRHAQTSNDRKPPAAVTVPQYRRPSHWRPRALHRRDKHKAALIDENQMRAQPPGFFLYAATRAASIVGFFSLASHSEHKTRVIPPFSEENKG